jgi:hypothetical protein
MRDEATDGDVVLDCAGAVLMAVTGKSKETGRATFFREL